jgi:hypothetical protein
VTLDFIIAGRRIRLQSGDGVTLLPDDRYKAFLATGGDKPELTVEVLPGKGGVPADARKVFDASLMEETPEGPRSSGEPFWEVLSDGGVIYAKASLRDPVRYPVLVIPHRQMTWKLYSDSTGEVIDPLPWPVDGLLLYFLSALKGDVMIHGSGVSCRGKGWLFTGRSGSGKTTLAGIFDRAGDRVIHDDRLIIRKETQGWMMHSTPVYRNDELRSVSLDHLWVIRHGRSNVSEPVAGSAAVAMVLANCIQQNWNREMTEQLAATVDDMMASVRVSRLAFVPDRSIRDYLVARESDSKILAADVATAILGEERSVTTTTGGYSMWPAIRPGDRVVIDPLKESMPAAGDIVALRRDGGYVVHRVYKVITRDGRQLFCTQGDAVVSPDEPSDEGMIAGIVRSIVRSGREIKPHARRLPRVLNRIASLFAGYILPVR